MSNTPASVFAAAFESESGTSGSGPLDVAKQLSKQYGLQPAQQRELANLITTALHEGDLVRVLTRGTGQTFVFRNPRTDAERRTGRAQYARARTRNQATIVAARAS